VDEEDARWTVRPAVDADELRLVEMHKRFDRPDRAQGLPPASRRQGDLRARIDLDDPAATEVRWPPLAREGPTEPLLKTAPGSSGAGRSPADD